jgi:hypothetical protein
VYFIRKCRLNVIGCISTILNLTVPLYFAAAIDTFGADREGSSI